MFWYLTVISYQIIALAESWELPFDAAVFLLQTQLRVAQVLNVVGGWIESGQGKMKLGDQLCSRGLCRRRFTCFSPQSCCSSLTSPSSCRWAAFAMAPSVKRSIFNPKAVIRCTFFSSVRFMFSNIRSNSSIMFWSLIWPMFHPWNWMVLSLYVQGASVSVTSSSTSLKSLRLLGRGSWPGG